MHLSTRCDKQQHAPAYTRKGGMGAERISSSMSHVILTDAIRPDEGGAFGESGCWTDWDFTCGELERRVNPKDLSNQTIALYNRGGTDVPRDAWPR